MPHIIVKLTTDEGPVGLRDDPSCGARFGERRRQPWHPTRPVRALPRGEIIRHDPRVGGGLLGDDEVEPGPCVVRCGGGEGQGHRSMLVPVALPHHAGRLRASAAGASDVGKMGT